MLNGILLVDKPSGVTSHTVVAMARRSLGTRKIGHAGTLDPLATGLLLLGVGPSTRLLTFLVGLDKVYRATIRFGQSTSTDDADGELLGSADARDVAALTTDRIAAAFAEQTGAIDQVPSSVSAIKVDGKRAYARVRAGEDVELAARRVTVHAIDVESVMHGASAEGSAVVDVTATVSCSSGTYIRAIARDAGRALGVGGHLTALRRTAIGPFRVQDAVPADAVSADALAPPGSIAETLFPVVRLDADGARELSNGRRVRGEWSSVPADVPVAAFAPDGHLVGIAAVEGGALRVQANFPQQEDVS